MIGSKLSIWRRGAALYPIVPICLLLLALAGCATLPPAPPAGAADHHIHIRSQAGADLSRSLCRRQPDSCPPEVNETAGELRGADAVRQLDDAGLSQGVLLSMAYLFASPATAYRGDIGAAVRAENAFTVAEARKYRSRLVPFVSVNPLHPSSEVEIRHWAARGARGIKLHVGAADIDLRDAAQVRRLVETFSLAGELRLPIVVHLRPQPPRPYGPEYARIMIDRLLPAARGVTVQIAHFGSGGGYDGESFAVMDAFAKAVEEGEPGLDGLIFDLSGILHPQLPDQVYDLIVGFSRRLGLQRIVMGSDWWGVESPEAYYEEARRKFPFSNDEWDYIIQNRAPYLR
jgi:predicted TIM-barrel fold metal-dependent hydrolase